MAKTTNEKMAEDLIETKIEIQEEQSSVESAEQGVFKSNPGVDLLYFVSNGQAFFTEDQALDYAKTLDNKEVRKIFKPTKN